MYIEFNWNCMNVFIFKAITGFRETEKTRWNAPNQAVLNRIRSTCFDDDEKMIPGVHVLDLAKNGWVHMQLTL